MLTKARMSRAGAFLCIASLLAAPAAAVAQTPAGIGGSSNSAAATNVVLGPNGSVRGVVRDFSGAGHSQAFVSIDFAGSNVATVETLEDGSFVVEGLRQGTHVVQACGGRQSFRFWNPENAPPGSQAEVVLVYEDCPPAGLVDPAAGNSSSTVGGEVQPYTPSVRSPRAVAPRRGFLGRAFANYPILTAAGLLGAGIGSGIAIGSGINDSPASP